MKMMHKEVVDGMSFKMCCQKRGKHPQRKMQNNQSENTKLPESRPER